MVWLSELKRTFQRLGEQEVQRPERWPVTGGLTAFYGLQTPSTSAPIKDISATGIQLGIQGPLEPEVGKFVTLKLQKHGDPIQKPLEVGQLVNLKLQREGDPELSQELQVTLQARVARHDRFGVGLAFVLPPGLDAELWDVLVRGLVLFTDPVQVLEVFRTLRTILFLGRLCQSRAKEAILLLGQHLHQDRIATLFRIARTAENLLAADPDADRMRADPTVVASLLRDGSWSYDELTTKLWEGLFVSSCSVDEPDDVNQIFVDLLVHLTPRQAGILIHACERALVSAPATGDFTPTPVVLSPDEITKLTGINDLSRNATDLAYLFNMGLIQNVFDFTSYRDFDTFDITPSLLGIELYRHCHGQRGKIDPQLVAAAREHLTVFFPPPLPSVFENYTPFVSDSADEK
ncbi:MAG: hypothetical protein ABSD59_08320 [Terracidiphilus sp.]